MSSSEKKAPDIDLIFSYETIFPDAAGLFYGGYCDLEHCFEKAFFVLDTNVLLMPYSLGNTSIAEIKKVYQKLIKEGRFFVPERVAREFAKNKTGKIADTHARIQQMKSGKTTLKFDFPTIIKGLVERADVDEALIKLNKAESEYFQSIDRLLTKVQSWGLADPVSELYSSLFEASIISSHNLTNEELDTQLKQRFKIKQPPGYKDTTKDDGGVGDLAIWISILELGRTHKKHAILVSEDGKPDWFQNSNGAAFLPRFELIDEYRRASNGKTLHIIKLSKLLELFDASKTAIVEAQSIETQSQELKIKAWLEYIELSKAVNKRTLSKQEQKEEILRWFHRNYADPAECCPYESAEGGFQYIWGGPYDARGAIESKWDDVASKKLINEIVNELNDKCWEWSRHPGYEDPNDYAD